MNKILKKPLILESFFVAFRFLSLCLLIYLANNAKLFRQRKAYHSPKIKKTRLSLSIKNGTKTNTYRIVRRKNQTSRSIKCMRMVGFYLTR